MVTFEYLILTLLVLVSIVAVFLFIKEKSLFVNDKKNKTRQCKKCGQVQAITTSIMDVHWTNTGDIKDPECECHLWQKKPITI